MIVLNSLARMFHELLWRDCKHGCACQPPRPPCEQGEEGGSLACSFFYPSYRLLIIPLAQPRAECSRRADDRFTVLSVHGHIINRAIPLAAGITYFTMVVLSIYKDTLKVNSILYMYPGTAMSTYNILNVFFFYHAPQNEYGTLSYS